MPATGIEPVWEYKSRRILSPVRLPVPPHRLGVLLIIAIIMIAATRMGFEPTTSAVTGRRSNQLSHRAIKGIYIPSKPHIELLIFRILTTFVFPKPYWSSPRPISNSQLHALRHFHLCPIYLVVFKGSYYLRMRYLILRGASRLDAFSVYPVRAWLPCHGVGTPTGTPAARPSRSSRTKDSSSQISYAHAG